LCDVQRKSGNDGFKFMLKIPSQSLIEEVADFVPTLQNTPAPPSTYPGASWGGDSLGDIYPTSSKAFHE